jgi:hypothetical protein
MADLVDIVIPANAQAAAEALGLKVHRSVTSGARVRQIPRDEAPRSRSSVCAIGAFPPASLRTRREVNPHRSAVRRRRHSDAFAVPCSDEPLLPTRTR